MKGFFWKTTSNFVYILCLDIIFCLQTFDKLHRHEIPYQLSPFSATSALHQFAIVFFSLFIYRYKCNMKIYKISGLVTHYNNRDVVLYNIKQLVGRGGGRPQIILIIFNDDWFLKYVDHWIGYVEWRAPRKKRQKRPFFLTLTKKKRVVEGIKKYVFFFLLKGHEKSDKFLPPNFGLNIYVLEQSRYSVNILLVGTTLTATQTAPTVA